MGRSFSNYARERDRLLQRIRLALLADDRVVGAWLAGSIGRGTADDLSDIDIWIAVDDVAMPEIAATPERFVRVICPTILEIPAPSNAPPGGAYLLTWVEGSQGPQQVDWYFAPVASACRPTRTRLLFSHREITGCAAAPAIAGDELDRELHGTIRDALLIIFVTSKHIARNNLWTVTRHLEHAARSVGRVEWLLDHGTHPAPDNPLLHLLPEALPSTPADQLEMLRALRDRLGELLVRSGRAEHFAAAVRAVDAAISARDTSP